MAEFEVNVVKIDDIYDHPNADRLSIVLIGAYEAVTMKAEDGSHRFVQGQPIVYVPEQAVVPEHLLKEFGFWDIDKNKGLLAGSKGNRVKAIRLRGQLSQGLVWVIETDPIVVRDQDRWKNVELGDNVADFYGIVKYEVPVPTQFAGHADSIPEAILHYDIENYQKFPNLIQEDEEVVATEKLHGTCFRVTYIPQIKNSKLFGNNIAVCSKGLGGKGLVFSDTEENRANNTYVQTMLEFTLDEKVRAIGNTLYPGKKVSLLSEIFGKGVQDLTYGMEKKTYRAFDIYVEGIGWLDEDTKSDIFCQFGIDRVPVLYRGKFNVEDLFKHRDGKTIFNSGFNVREGIVVTVVGDQTSRKQGGHTLRPFVKMINPDYLLRKGETTEFN